MSSLWDRVDPLLMDTKLLEHNELIKASLLSEAEKLYNAGDLRWFFTFSHGKITEQINDNIVLFERPNDLLRFNIQFSGEFLKALGGAPHKDWEEAFKYCKALEKGGKSTSVLVFETEFCGAKMANVHIHDDISAALNEVGCISPQDFENVLVFVNRGALAALVKLRGRMVGAAEAVGLALFSPLFDMDVRTWRNEVYKHVCGIDVPSVEESFSRRIR